MLFLGSSSDLLADSTCLFADDAIQRRMFDINFSPTSITSAFASDSNDVDLFALVEKSKQVFKLKVPGFGEHEVC